VTRQWTALAAAPKQHPEVAATSLGELIRVSGGRRLTRSERTAYLLEQMELHEHSHLWILNRF
jgi:hypothetical protein